MSETSNWRDKIDWQYFSRDERDKIEVLVDRGEVNKVAGAVYMGPHRDSLGLERELQKVMDIFKPYNARFESKVAKELTRELVKNPTLLNDPAAEQEWHVKKRDEWQVHLAGEQQKAQARVEAASDVVSTPKQDTKKEEKPKAKRAGRLKKQTLPEKQE